VAAQTKAREILAANLKRLRNAAGITQEVLAERAGCSPTMIGNLEIGKRFPSAELLDKIAQAFDVPIFELFMEESPAIPWTRAKAEVRERLTKEIGLAIDTALSDQEKSRKR
jgi:transcriptional regulator with XRE-family HTH domain